MQSNLLGVFCVFFFHAVTMFILCPSRCSRGTTVAAWSAVTALSVGLSFFLIRRFPTFWGALLTFLAAAVIFVATVFFLSRSAVYQTLFLLLTYLEAFIVALFLSGFLSQRFFHGSAYVGILIRCLLQLLIVLFCTILRQKFQQLSQGITSGWWSLNILAALLLSYLTILVMRTYSTGFAEELQTTSVFLLIVILVAVYAVFFHTIQLMYNAAEKQRAELQSQFLLRQVEMMEASVQEAQRIRHDARHHNLQIQEYLQNGQHDALLRYLGEYERDAERNRIVTLCENLAANSILCAYSRKAMQQGIAVHTDVTLERDAGISDIDLVAILANLMENAINGCLGSGKPQPVIHVYLGRKVKKLVIVVRNTSHGEVVFENGLPKSQAGGIGITSILHSASRYAGEYDFRNEDGFFSCQLLLKVPEAGRNLE